MGDSGGLGALFPLSQGSSVGWLKKKISVGSFKDKEDRRLINWS